MYLENSDLAIYQIAERLDVPKDLVSSIKCGKRWKCISKFYNFYKGKHWRWGGKHEEENIDKICMMLFGEIDYSNKEIIDATGIAPSRLSAIKHRRRWRSISDKYFSK
mgnify:CR=1 FL=1